MWLAWIILMIVALSVRQVARFANTTHAAKMDALRRQCGEASADILDMLLLDNPLPQGLEIPAAIATVAVASGQTIDDAIKFAVIHVPGTSYKELKAATADSLGRSSHHLKLVFSAFRSV